MKGYTDLVQSKKLAKILSLKSADMYYLIKRSDCRVPWEEAAKDDTNVILFTMEVMSGNLSDYKFPCWSLAALIDILPRETRLLKSATDNTYHCDCPKCNSDKWFDNPVDACVNMIITLHEHKLLLNK